MPTISRTVPTGSQWVFEIKHDGFRFLAVRQGNRVRVFSRGGHDWSKQLPAIVETMQALPVHVGGDRRRWALDADGSDTLALPHSRPLMRSPEMTWSGPMTDFEKAQHHVNEGRRIVAEQRARVADLKAHGRDAYMAQQDLQLFEDSLAIFEDYLAHLQRQQVR
ncbi:MAG: hypothetical protein JOZ17_06925 [Acetobacteraceae bacterium]|nr:hypothetical protein [Acetobacteraceae bacterium]